MRTRPTSLRASLLARPLRIACAALLVGSALTVSSPALADGPAQAAPAATTPGQKPPCVPASSYVLAYDCELFPLPALPSGAGGAAPAAAGAAAGGAPAPDAAAAPAAAAPAAAPATDTSSSSSTSPSHAPAYVAFVLGAGGVGTTVAFGVLALQTKSTLSKDCPNGNCPSQDSQKVSNLKLYDNMADIGLGVAAAGVITGVILYLTEKPSSSTGARHVEPWIGLASGGVRGSF